MHPVKNVQHLGVLLLVHGCHHLVALLGRAVGGVARNPAHLHLHLARQRGVKAVQQEDEELGHVVLLKPGKQVHVLEFGDFLHGGHKAARRNDAVAGPQHGAQLVPLVQQHRIHFVVQARLVFAAVFGEKFVEFVRVRQHLQARVHVARVAQVAQTAQALALICIKRFGHDNGSQWFNSTPCVYTPFFQLIIRYAALTKYNGGKRVLNPI